MWNTSESSARLPRTSWTTGNETVDFVQIFVWLAVMRKSEHGDVRGAASSVAMRSSLKHS